MTDISTVAANALDAVNNLADANFVEETDIRRDGKKVRYGKASDVVEAMLKLQAAKSSRFHLAKFARAKT